MHALVSLTAVLLAASPQTLKVPSSVDEVTVYQGSAKVTRIARLELPAGDSRVVLEGLPPELVDDSLRTGGKGSVRAKIFGAEVERFTHAQAQSPEARALQDTLTGLETQDRTLQDELQVAQARKAFIDSLRSTFVQERTQNLPLRAADPKEWSAMAEFVTQQTQLVQEQLRKAELQRQALAKRVEAARAELAKLQSKQTVSTKTVVVDLRSEKAGAFELHVSYVVPRAQWTPVWDARLDPTKSTVELSLYGLVTQATGEDWSDVKLSLSTAQPSRSLAVPDLEPRYLDVYARARRAGDSEAYRSVAAPPPMAVKSAESMGDEDGGGAPEEQVYALEQPTAVVQEGLLSTSFEAPRRESIDGSGRARKAFLSAQTLKADVLRVTAPSQDPNAYLTATAKNASGLVLLGGPANVFLEDEFLGRTQLPLIPPGDEVKLAFGLDERVKVERRLVERKHETAGVLSKDDVHRYRYVTKLKNLYAVATTVTVLEQVPVSRDEKIEVKVLPGTTKVTEAADVTKPGVRVHKVTLAPGAEKTLELAYEVRFPRGQAVSGIE